MFNWFNRLVARMLLRYIAYAEQNVEVLRELSQRGRVVYALPFKSSLLLLGIKQVAKELNLPPATTILFLKRPQTLLTDKTSPRKDTLSQLLADQRYSRRPIYIVPHMLVLGRRRTRADKSAMDLVFGSRDAPGYLRLVARLILSQGQAHWQIGEPISLLESSSQPAQLRFALRRQFRRLETTHIGPRAKSYDRIKRETLKDPSLVAYAKNVSQETGVPNEDTMKKCRSYFHEIAANFDGDFVRMLGVLLRLLFNRIYDGILWNPSEIAQLRKASLKGPLILLPTHKSHMDYLVMSYVLYQEGLMPPHIAAGANLSFFPLGSIFRRGGAYFIRRQFKGDPLYPKVVRAYLNRLLKEGFTQEFFIEGARSRTGKTLSPKAGLLSIYVDCLCSDKFQNAVFVPTSIAYERIVESKSYDEEQAGKPKKKESAKTLLSSTQVLIKRFGRVFVSFDKPVVLSEFMASRQFDYGKATPEEKQRFVKSLAHQVVMGMNQATVVTPAAIIAMVLLSSKTRALREDRFIAQALDVLGLLQAIHPDIRLSDALANFSEESIGSALDLLAQDGQIVKRQTRNLSYVLAPAKTARALNFYKNTIIHFFVSDALIACAFYAESKAIQNVQVPLHAVQLRVQKLSKIFKFEFVFPVELSFEQVFAKRIEFLKSRGIFEALESDLIVSSTPQAREDLDFLCRMLKPFFENYFVVFNEALSSDLTTLTDKDLIASSLKHLNERLQSGLLTRPEAVNKQYCESATLSLKSFCSDGQSWPDRSQISEPYRAINEVLAATD